MSYHIGFWNVENLFSPEGFDQREPWIAQKLASELREWTPALYERKLSQLATIIGKMNGDLGPDILGVCEIENEYALRDLARKVNDTVGERDYDIVHVDSTRDKRGIDTAFLFDRNIFSLDSQSVFSHFVMRRTGTRDITQATFTSEQTGNELVIFCNHWPSRSGSSAAASSGFRATAGETLAYFHERVRESKGSDTAVLSIGDLNDDPFDASVRYNANAWREQGDVERSRSAKFYNLSWNYLTQELIDHNGSSRTIDGTLYYKNDGNCFDQIFANRSLLKGENGLIIDTETASIEAIQQMVDHRMGYGPIRFGLPKGDAANVNQDGYSDHFPVSVTVREITD